MSTCDSSNITLEETSDAVKLALAASRYVLVIVGVLANLVVIIVFINCKTYKTCFTYLLVFQQACMDLMGCCLYFIFYNYRVPDGEYGIVYCKCRTIFWIFASASGSNLVYISIERYIAVVHPLKYWRREKRKIKMVFKLCVPWLLAIVFTFQLAIYLVPDELSPGNCRFCYSSESVRLISGGSILLFFYIIPVVVMTFCYYRVYVTMQKRLEVRATVRSNSNCVLTDRSDDIEIRNDFKIENSKKESTQYIKNQTNFITTMAVTTLVFAISISPLLIVYIVYSLCDCFDYDRHPIRQATHISFVSSLVANPFVYAFKFSEFKKGFKKTFIRRGI
ncbi:G-protein coupled receptor 54-like [Anneissia japonica]|uniref:G-protein coupled receptor 54-like n=1 Tax=Anneissia japonica TaxID=1529436 RepID=UPI001425AB6B|nr:G-protein coupled receptor 54-like [Anneissia japonica]